MKKTLATALAATLIGTGAASAGQWQKIGAGPSYDYAEAYCNLAVMGNQPGHFVMGSPEYVFGSQLGYAIGSAVRNNAMKKNCMVLQGWKFVYGQTNAPARIDAFPPAPRPTKFVRKNGQRYAVSATPAARDKFRTCVNARGSVQVPANQACQPGW